MQIIDLSLPITTDRQMGTKVKHHSHLFNRFLLRIAFGIKKAQLKTGLAWANDTITMNSCSTTHLEAPWHIAPASEGKPAKKIDRFPLEWGFAPGVVLDVSHRKDGEEITLADITDALEKISYTITPLDIVLIRTGNDRYFGTPDYPVKGCGMSAEATRWILDQGVKVAGIDAMFWDLPLRQLAQKAKQSDRNDVFWEAHFVGVDKEFFCLERLTNLDKLPPFGFKVSCLPLYIKDAAAAPVRAVAILEG